MKNIILRDDWYESSDGFYHIVFTNSKGNRRHRRFWSRAAAGAYVERMLKRKTA